MLIAFIHPFKSFLPEIAYYQAFFSKYGIETIVVKNKEAESIIADVKWYSMGIDYTKKEIGTIKIHEYASLSVPPFAHLKNKIKKTIVSKPDFRLFLNEFVKDELAFNDNIPFGLRDMGIPNNISAFTFKKNNPKYDFIYIGSVDKGRKINKLLDKFTSGQLNKFTLLILSNNYIEIAKKYEQFKNIIFFGPVPQQQVADFILASRFAINYCPTNFPYNEQTSTKFLEYAACKIPIITTDYTWVQSFQEKYGGNYFFLNENMDNFKIENILKHKYTFPNILDWTWTSQINNSGVVNFLKTKFPENFKPFYNH